jgi:hypothetical protein
VLNVPEKLVMGQSKWLLSKKQIKKKRTEPAPTPPQPDFAICQVDISLFLGPSPHKSRKPPQQATAVH